MSTSDTDAHALRDAWLVCPICPHVEPEPLTGSTQTDKELIRAARMQTHYAAHVALAATRQQETEPRP